MCSRKLSRLVFCLFSVIPAVALANVSVNQTFTNNTGQAAAGFNWWFTPDCTTSSVGSNVFSAAATSHYNPGTHGYTTSLRMHYSSGNVNNAGTATQWATLNNNSVIGYRTEWTDSLGVPIGSANIPCSLGGEYHVNLQNDRVWIMRIDNPTNGPLYINNYKYGISQLQISGPGLQSFANWTPFASNIVVPPGSAFEHEVVVPDSSYFALASAELHGEFEPADVSTVIFQVTPEPLGLSALLLGVLVSKRARRCE